MFPYTPSIINQWYQLIVWLCTYMYFSLYRICLVLERVVPPQVSKECLSSSLWVNLRVSKYLEHFQETSKLLPWWLFKLQMGNDSHPFIISGTTTTVYFLWTVIKQSNQTVHIIYCIQHVQLLIWPLYIILNYIYNVISALLWDQT